jgi:hypothetical protein
VCTAPVHAAGTGLLALPAVAPVMACARLKAADLKGVADRPIHIMAASEDALASAHPYCRIQGYVEPAVNFEVQLPLAGWTQRFLQIGCGGLCGELRLRLDEHTRGCAPADNGELALATSDMGHRGGMDGSWAAHDLQARIDFAYRGMHVTAQVAKALIARYYGRGPRFAYFSGCSDGGREALMEAQRYPGDFNGIAAGAPALNFSVQNSFYHGWNAVSNTAPDGNPILIASRLPLLHAAVIAACDGADGLKDGLIEDPRRCPFDPASIQCREASDPSTCLTPAEVGVVRNIYAGAHDAAGRRLVLGGPMPGSELAWAGVFIPERAHDPIFSGLIATGSVRNLYYPEALPETWTLKDLKYDQATLDSFSLRSIYDATNPDLGRFQRAGGRLIIWHGWSDPHISPLNSIAYFSAMQKALGERVVSRFARLFLVPGMYHCNGGEGGFQFDVLTPLMAWVESAAAPDQLVAAGHTPPVLAYPLGSSIPDVDWLGAKYLVPGLQQVCAAVGTALKCQSAP